MTNKIYLSFNRLYTLKDGDYHGATLTYRIKHSDVILAEGEINGKSLSPFIRPIDIKETEITQPLTVEYICTGNVENVSAFSAMSDPGFLIDQSCKVFIKNAHISQSIISNALTTTRDACESKEEKRIKKLVIDNVTEQITKMLQPSGLLFRK